ncbi:MAG: class I adenylate-forming enzyme family protein [Aquabacterium sp.]
MALIDRLSAIWDGCDEPFLIFDGHPLHFGSLRHAVSPGLASVQPGDVVALIADFDPAGIATLLALIDVGAVVVPLTVQTREDHPYFFDAAGVDVVIEGDTATRRHGHDPHQLVLQLRQLGHPGLVLFSSGTTARPKAILHDLTHFLRRFNTPRPSLRTLNFLLFDHIGGLNTLLHTLFNRGTVVALRDRSIDRVLRTCRDHAVEVLPTTPTFLRMMLISGAIPDAVPACLKVITYGTERMDLPTLQQACALLPAVDFRQTFGMSELGIVRVKSLARDSLFMTIGGEGVETRVVDDVLHIRAQARMMGYLNAPSPFDADGWYDTRDVVEQLGRAIKVVGRLSDLINVGGLKFMPSEVERVVLTYPGVSMALAHGRRNPITGQHVELKVQAQDHLEIDAATLTAFLKERLPPHMRPRRVTFEAIAVGHRFKKAGQ